MSNSSTVLNCIFAANLIKATPEASHIMTFLNTGLEIFALLFLITGLFAFLVSRRSQTAANVPTRRPEGRGSIRRIGIVSSSMVAVSIVSLVLAGSNIVSTSHSPLETSPTKTPLSSLKLVKPGELTVGVDPLLIPQDVVDGKKQPIGFDIDFVNALAQSMHLKKATIVLRSPSEQTKDLENNNLDLIISTDFSDDSKQSFLSIPYLDSNAMVITNNKSNRLEDLMALTDLCGNKVGVQENTVEAEELKAVSCVSSNLNVNAMQNPEILFRALKEGKIDLIYQDADVGSYYTKKYIKNGINRIRFTRINKRVMVLNSQNTNLHQVIEKNYNSLVQSGSYQKLLVKWDMLQDALPDKNDPPRGPA